MYKIHPESFGNKIGEGWLNSTNEYCFQYQCHIKFSCCHGQHIEKKNVTFSNDWMWTAIIVFFRCAKIWLSFCTRYVCKWTEKFWSFPLLLNQPLHLWKKVGCCVLYITDKVLFFFFLNIRQFQFYIIKDNYSILYHFNRIILFSVILMAVLILL